MQARVATKKFSSSDWCKKFVVEFSGEEGTWFVLPTLHIRSLVQPFLGALTNGRLQVWISGSCTLSLIVTSSSFSTVMLCSIDPGIRRLACTYVCVDRSTDFLFCQISLYAQVLTGVEWAGSFLRDSVLNCLTLQTSSLEDSTKRIIKHWWATCHCISLPLYPLLSRLPELTVSGYSVSHVCLHFVHVGALRY